MTEEDTLAHSTVLCVAEEKPQTLEVRVAAAEALTHGGGAARGGAHVARGAAHAVALGLPLKLRQPEEVAQPVKLHLLVQLSVKLAEGEVCTESVSAAEGKEAEEAIAG